MRTGVSEDAKGDVTKDVTHQGEPDRRAREGVEPLLPPPETPRRSAGAEEQEAKTASDRRGEAAPESAGSPDDAE